MSAVELAVDLHAIRVIATNNYQQCIRAIWRGYYTIQYDDEGCLAFAQYSGLLSRRFVDHFDPQRMKGTIFPTVLLAVPLYQNLHNLFFPLLFVALYTISVNKPDSNNSMDAVE